MLLTYMVAMHFHSYTAGVPRSRRGVETVSATEEEQSNENEVSIHCAHVTACMPQLPKLTHFDEIGPLSLYILCCPVAD